MQAARANGFANVVKRSSWFIHRRNIGLTAVIAQKVASDPIQKLFVDKVKEYAQKTKASGGKLFEASPEVEKEYKDEINRIEKQFGGGKGVDLTKFPTFNFTDPTIDPINLTEKK